MEKKPDRLEYKASSGTTHSFSLDPFVQLGGNDYNMLEQRGTLVLLRLPNLVVSIVSILYQDGLESCLRVESTNGLNSFSVVAIDIVYGKHPVFKTRLGTFSGDYKLPKKFGSDLTKGEFLVGMISVQTATLTPIGATVSP